MLFKSAPPSPLKLAACSVMGELWGGRAGCWCYNVCDPVHDLTSWYARVPAACMLCSGEASAPIHAQALPPRVPRSISPQTEQIAHLVLLAKLVQELGDAGGGLRKVGEPELREEGVAVIQHMLLAFCLSCKQLRKGERVVKARCCRGAWTRQTGARFPALLPARSNCVCRAEDRA